MATRDERISIRESHPDSWVAVDEGDLLIGKVADVTEAWSDKRNNLKGGFYPLLTIDHIEQMTGYDPVPAETKVHCFGTVLFNEVMRKKPEVGERIRFIYRGEGEDKRKTGNPPMLYSVTVAGRKDAGARAYGKIEGAGTVPVTPAAPAGQPQPQPEPVQTELVEAPQDDDIPF